MMSSSAALVLAFVQAACAGKVHLGLKHEITQHAHTTKHETTQHDLGRSFSHRLRVCNAYPSSVPLDVSRGRAEKLTGNEPMPYKTCRDFTEQLKSGDRLSFKAGPDNAGSFSIADLPNNDAVLLLVIHRHDTLTNAVAFESHVFANLMNAQIAVIDTYKGSERGSPTLIDSTSLTTQIEKLHYNSVFAVNQGAYNVVLEGFNHTEKATKSLVAINRESYIVLRVGVEAQIGDSFPEELVVFPNSKSSLLNKMFHSGAASILHGSFASLLAATVMCALSLW